MKYCSILIAHTLFLTACSSMPHEIDTESSTAFKPILSSLYSTPAAPTGIPADATGLSWPSGFSLYSKSGRHHESYVQINWSLTFRDTENATYEVLIEPVKDYFKSVLYELGADRDLKVIPRPFKLEPDGEMNREFHLDYVYSGGVGLLNFFVIPLDSEEACYLYVSGFELRD